MADKVAKGRQALGEQCHAAKLTAAIVTEIRARYAAGNVTHKTLAAEYGITQSNVSMIIHRQTWTHLP